MRNRSLFVTLVLVVCTASLVGGSALVDLDDDADDTVVSHGVVAAASTKSVKPQISRASQSRIAARWERRLARREARRTKWLGAPEQRAERASSRVAFAGVSPTRALDLARKKLPAIAVAPAWKGPQLRGGEKISSYETAVAAHVVEKSVSESKNDLTNSRSLLIQSTAGPIAAPDASQGGKLAGIDTTLEQDSKTDAWKPKLTATNVLLPKNAGGIVEIGETQKFNGIGVRFANGPNSDLTSKTGVLIGGSKLFYADTDKDTDAVVESTSTGVSISWVLRSPAAPEGQGLDLSLPPGSSLRLRMTVSVDMFCKRGMNDYQAVAAVRTPKLKRDEGSLGNPIAESKWSTLNCPRGVK